MNTHYTYFLILAIAVAGPIALSFDKKVAFYTKWKYLLLSMLIPALLYIAWDIYFTYKGTWSFNEKYYVTASRVFNLPLEEILFFFLVPYCCVFIYECIRSYFPGLKNKRAGDIILISLAIFLLVTAIIFHNRMYTSWVCKLLPAYIGLIYLFRKYFRSFDAISFLAAFLIIIVPFLLVNGFLTALPVVEYNDTEILNIRIYTIPVEDVFYGMLLTLMNISIYEKVLKRK